MNPEVLEANNHFPPPEQAMDLSPHRALTIVRMHAALAAIAILAACGGGDGPAPAPPPDARNGSYTIYATTGERFTLTLDFDTRQYAIGSPQISISALNVSGTFIADTVAGTYVFQGTGSGRTTKFRHVDDMVVGSHSFENVVQPFVGSRRFAQSVSEAAGSYGNFGINRNNGVGDSRIYSSRINTNSTLELCINNIIYTIENCPETTVQRFNLSLNGDLFNATPQAAGEPFSFRVARAGTERVYLMGAINQATGARFFRIGVAQSAAFTPGAAIGASTLGEWGQAVFTTTSYGSTGMSLDGNTITLNGNLTPLTPTGPTVMRGMTASGGNAFVMQNSQLGILVGARNGAAAGYMQIGAR